MNKRGCEAVDRHYDTLKVLADNADEHYEKYGIELGFDARKILGEYHNDNSTN